MSMIPRTHMLLILLGLSALALPAAGCRGDRSDKPPRQFFPDMDDQPKYKAQAESHFFEDGRSMRLPVAGTVPFGRRTEQGYDEPGASGRIAMERADLLRDDPRFYTGLESDGSYVERIPMQQALGVSPGAPVNSADARAFIELGRENFNIYCITCHGGSGDGDGMVGQRWSTPIPSYHQEQYWPGGEKGQDGLIFSTIRTGVANPPGVEPRLKMQSYADKVTERESWAIVAYIRALQRSRGAPQPAAAAAPANEEATP